VEPPAWPSDSPDCWHDNALAVAHGYSKRNDEVAAYRLLFPAAVEILELLRDLSGSEELLFPGEQDRKKPMSNMTILKALERMDYKGRMTGHGFRSPASTILHEQGYNHEHIGLQIGPPAIIRPAGPVMRVLAKGKCVHQAALRPETVWSAGQLHRR
jgi:hypothetical protein